MEIHRGRLVDHIHLRAHDLAASKQFYRAVLQVTGQGRAPSRKPTTISRPTSCG
jgi:catechol 2,3-dioxygenase-like lactoylglutathione lyase family enzyme